MASSPIRHGFEAPDGIELAWHELGEGRPACFCTASSPTPQTNWIRFGHAAEIAGRGVRLIMPDLRAHGTSATPHDPACYPPDILAADGLALIAHLGLEDYDLGGYSLGARTAVRMVVGGAAPRRLVISGMGLDGLTDTGARSAHFKAILNDLGTHERGSPEWLAEAFLKTTGGDPMRCCRCSTASSTPARQTLRAIAIPTLVLSGAEDHDNGSAEALARAAARGEYVEVPGNHMSAVTKPELGRALARFSRPLTAGNGGSISAATPKEARMPHESRPSRCLPSPSPPASLRLHHRRRRRERGRARGAVRARGRAGSRGRPPPRPTPSSPGPSASSPSSRVINARAQWVNATYITQDTDALAAHFGTIGTEMGVRFANEAARFQNVAGPQRRDAAQAQHPAQRAHPAGADHRGRRRRAEPDLDRPQLAIWPRPRHDERRAR